MKLSIKKAKLSLSVYLGSDSNGLLALTKENADIIEIIIASDIRYRRKKTKKSFTIAFTNLKSIKRTTLEDIIKTIAASNSTRTSLQDIKLFCDYILDSKNCFWNKLSEGDISLPDDITNYVVRSGGKKHKSLASKICKYLSLWRYGKDNYFINDSIVRQVLPYYLLNYKVVKKHTLTNLDLYDYKDLHNLLDSLLKTINSKNKSSLSKHELDHLLWYFYKNNIAILSIAELLGKDAFL